MRVILLSSATLFLGILCLVGIAANVEASAPNFIQESPVSSKEGYHSLQWEYKIEGASSYELQRAQNPRFEDAVTIYNGSDKGSFISGLKDGKYYYRVRDSSISGNWSEPLLVEVDHFDIGFAISLFAVGLFVFLATLAVLVIANIKGSGND